MGKLYRAIINLILTLNEFLLIRSDRKFIITIDDLDKLGDRIMSAITDYTAKVQAAFDAISTSVDDIAADITQLQTTIANFNNSPGTLSATDQAALDDVQAKATALVTKIKALDTATSPTVLPVAPTS